MRWTDAYPNSLGPPAYFFMRFTKLGLWNVGTWCSNVDNRPTATANNRRQLVTIVVPSYDISRSVVISTEGAVMLLCRPHKRSRKIMISWTSCGGGAEAELSSPSSLHSSDSDLLSYTGPARLRYGMTSLSSFGHNGNAGAVAANGS